MVVLARFALLSLLLLGLAIRPLKGSPDGSKPGCHPETKANQGEPRAGAELPVQPPPAIGARDDTQHELEADSAVAP